MKPHLPELEGLGRSLDSCYETLEVIRMGQAGYPRMLIDRTKMIVLLSTEISGRLPAYEFASAPCEFPRKVQACQGVGLLLCVQDRYFGVSRDFPEV